ncbi:hypothetical protein BASA81_006678 [Batrachochytrium salamandrivorans]|nr:hypothetical protein BASA81_006678 [Batrachochytrium salamandrivorans]
MPRSFKHWERMAEAREREERLHNTLFFALLAVGTVVFYILHLNTSEKLEQAILRRNWRKAKQIVEQCKRLPPTRGVSVLVEAIEAGASIEFITLLLVKGAGVNERSRDDWTPLHSAIFKSASSEVIKLLIRHGADINARTKCGSAPLHFACGRNAKELVELLLGCAGIQVNAINHQRETALHWAAKANALRAAQCLVRAGAKVELVNDKLENAWMLAPSPQMRDLLRRAGVIQSVLLLLHRSPSVTRPAISRLPRDLIRILLRDYL